MRRFAWGALCGALVGSALTFTIATALAQQRPSRPWLATYAPTEGQWADVWLRANCSYVGTGATVQARTEANFDESGRSMRNVVVHIDHLKKVKTNELELAKSIAQRCKQEFTAAHKKTHGDFSWAFPVNIVTKEIE